MRTALSDCGAESVTPHSSLSTLEPKLCDDAANAATSKRMNNCMPDIALRHFPALY